MNDRDDQNATSIALQCCGLFLTVLRLLACCSFSRSPPVGG